MNIIDNLAEYPGVCAALSVLLFLFGYLSTYTLLSALLKMHRSRSAVKKLMKQYSIGQKLWLVPYEADSLHAVTLCKIMVWYRRIGCVAMGAYLLAVLGVHAGLISATALAWLTVGRFAGFDLPPMLISTALSRPIIGRFREFSFEKYHNTNDHDSLL